MSGIHTVRYILMPAREGAFTPGREMRIKSIILHSSCGREAGDLETLTGNTERVVSCHWYINRCGVVYHLVQNCDTAYHAGKVNNPNFGNAASIGIEQEHFDPDENHLHGQDWPRSQIESAARLCAFLIQKHHLSLRDIVSHAHAADPPGRKTDPVNYPWDDFLERVEIKLQETWQAEQLENESIR